MSESLSPPNHSLTASSDNLVSHAVSMVISALLTISCGFWLYPTFYHVYPMAWNWMLEWWTSVCAGGDWREP